MADPIAIIGAGLVGSGWAIVFARAGHRVAVYDSSVDTLDRVPDLIRSNLQDLASFDLIDDADAVFDRIRVVSDLAEAVQDVAYVQESVFETVAAKKDIFSRIDDVVSPDTIIGSSSSGIPASAFTEGLNCRNRCLISHPVNPPYLVPLVELVPAPWTDPAVVDWVYNLMRVVKQEPIRIAHEVEGFVLNRLQGALLNEAWALFDEGYASVEDIDKTVSFGLGLRWSFIGPFETIDLNAPNGIADYAHRLGPLYHSVAKDRTKPEPWGEDLIRRVDGERRQALPAAGLDKRRAWRDRRLMALAAHKAKAAKTII